MSVSLRLRALAGALPLLFALAQPVQAATPVTFLYEICSSCAPADLVWSNGEFDQVRKVAAEAGAQNRAPLTVSVDALSRLLQEVQLQDGKGSRPWLEADGAQQLAQGIASFLQQAQPQQDGIFLVTSRSAAGFVSGKLGNSGRVFADASGIQIIVGEAGVDFFNAYRATRMLRTFAFGSRQQASAVRLQSPYLKAGRSDWLQLPFAAQAAAPAVSLPAPLAAPVQLAPATPVVAVPAPVAAPAAAVRDEQFYAAQELRLKSLKRLREQNLITEDEFQAKRRAILQEM